MSNLLHLIYSSRETKNFTEDELIKLLESSRKKNLGLGITGMLLYNDGNFFQILEGDEETITQLYTVIMNDNRHDKITKIVSEFIPHRSFNGWEMGFANITNEQLETIEGLNDFFTEKKCLADIDPGRAKKLLKAFSSGHWQQQLQK